MSAVSSHGSEPLVLARRGLPFAASVRRFAPAPWFASFAFVRSRVPPRSVSPAMPGMELPSAVPVEMESDARRAEIPVRVELKTQAETAASFPRHVAAFEDEPISVQRTQAPVGAKTVLVGPAPAVERTATAQAASRMSQAAARPPLDEAPREAYSRAPLGAGLSMQTPSGVALDDAPGDAPGERTPLPVSEASVREVIAPVREVMASVREVAVTAAVTAAATAPGRVPMLQKIAGPVAALAPARFATPVGTRPGAPRGDSSTAAPRTEIAQLAGRSRAAPAANAAGRVTHRIGIVQVVVRTEVPQPRPVPPAAAQTVLDDRAPAQRPVARPFRNPWASSRWRDD